MEPVVLHSIKFHLCLCELWFGVAEVGSSDFFHGLALSVGLTFFFQSLNVGVVPETSVCLSKL